MAFSDFTFPDVVRDLGLTLVPATDLFAAVDPIPVGPDVRRTYAWSVPFATTIHTEKARSEWIVAPLLGDFWRRYAGRIGLYSGATLVGDPDAGLAGVCDFILSAAPQLPYVVAPVAVLFEAKRDSIPDGFGQCIAAMIGADRFNRREGNPIPTVYGCVTTGTNWKFLRLQGTTVALDLPEYNLSQIDTLLGIFAHMVGPVPGVEPAAA